MSNLTDLDSKPTLVYLWIHETFRVFRDRLVDANDREKYSILAHEKLENYLNMDWKLKEFENVLFGDYETSNRSYVKLSEVNQLIPRLDSFLDLYNADNSQMNLVFFSDCI